jgi:hypothetical protein
MPGHCSSRRTLTRILTRLRWPPSPLAPVLRLSSGDAIVVASGNTSSYLNVGLTAFNAAYISGTSPATLTGASPSRAVVRAAASSRARTPGRVAV